jgi:hypothetical protein
MTHCGRRIVDLFVTSDDYNNDTGGDISRVWLCEYALVGINTGAPSNTTGTPVVLDTPNNNFEALDFVVLKIDGLNGAVNSNNSVLHK